MESLNNGGGNIDALGCWNENTILMSIQEEKNRKMKNSMKNLPVAGVDVDANACVDVDDGVTPVADTVIVVQQLSQPDPKIDYLVHDEDDQLDQLCLFV